MAGKARAGLRPAWVSNLKGFSKLKGRAAQAVLDEAEAPCWLLYCLDEHCGRGVNAIAANGLRCMLATGSVQLMMAAC
jgi:hypothetical protein